jgi:hypothetical protein
VVVVGAGLAVAVVVLGRSLVEVAAAGRVVVESAAVLW